MAEPRWTKKKDDLLMARFEAKVILGGDCRIWLGANDGRYGEFWDGTRKVKAHRMAWVFENGPVPQGLRVLHLCNVKLCVNPAHLELGGQSRNMAYAWETGEGHNQNDRKTHCKRGHRLAGQNLIVRHSGHRQCRVCKNTLWRELRAAR